MAVSRGTASSGQFGAWALGQMGKRIGSRASDHAVTDKQLDSAQNQQLVDAVESPRMTQVGGYYFL